MPLKTAPHSRELDHVSLLKWPVEEGEERVWKTNQRLCLAVVLVRATGLWFSLSLFGSSHKSIDVPKLVLTANGFIKSPRLTFHPPPAHPWSLKVNVKFQNYAAKCSQALNRLKTLNSHVNRSRRRHRQLGNSNMQMRSAQNIFGLYIDVRR